MITEARSQAAKNPQGYGLAVSGNVSAMFVPVQGSKKGRVTWSIDGKTASKADAAKALKAAQ